MRSEKSTLPARHRTSKLLVLCDPENTLDQGLQALFQRKIHLVQKPIAQDRIQEYLDEFPDCILIIEPALDQCFLDLLKDLRMSMVNPLLLFRNSLAPEQVLAAYQAGVDEVITAPVSRELMHAKVSAWLKRAWTIPTQMIGNIVLPNCRLNVSEWAFIWDGCPPLRLTNLELRLLYLLMSRSPRAVSQDEILQRVWGHDSEADSGALKNVIYRLRRKIEADPSHPRHLLTAAGRGYQFATA